MKKALLCIALFCAITGYIYGDSAVDSTRSMSSTHLGAIRNAFSGGDAGVEHYWEKFVDTTPTKEDSTRIFDLYGIKQYNLFNSHLYTKEALWGAVGL